VIGVLLDTNIVVRLVEPAPEHARVRGAMAAFEQQRLELVVAPQVLIEF
jgi:predicted nucleic acid-binding protein